MEQQTTTNSPAVQFPAIRRKPVMPPDPDMTVPARGGEPRSIGRLMEPIQKIIEHPDRNRLLAEFCRRYW